MTFSAVVCFIVGLVVAFLCGAVFACFRLKGALKTKGKSAPALSKVVVRALSVGGGGGPIEVF